MMTNLLKEFFSDFCRKRFNVDTGIEMLKFNDHYTQVETADEPKDKYITATKPVDHESAMLQACG